MRNLGEHMAAKSEKIPTKSSPQAGSSKARKDESKRPQRKETAPGTPARQQRVDLSAEELVAELNKIKAITPYAVASRFNVKISEAKRILRGLEKQGRIRCVGGNSRIKIYSPAAS